MKTMHCSEQNICQVTTATKDPETLQSSKCNCHEHSISRQMNPVLQSLSVFAINLHRKCKCPCQEFGVANVARCVYNTAVLLFVLANACRLMMVYHQQNATELQLIFKIQNTLWIAQNAGHYVKFLISSQFKAFLVSYQEYVDEYKTELVSIKRIAYKCITLSWCLLLLDFTFSIYHIYIHDTHDEIDRWPLQDNSNFEMFMQFIYIVFVCHITAMWLGISLIICFVSFCLTHEYGVINKEILQLSHSDFLQRLEHFRRRHHKVGNLTGLFDKCISLHFAIDASCDLTVCCLLLYELIWDQCINNDVGPIITFTIWITINITKVIVVIFCAGRLNDSVSNSKIQFSHFAGTGHKNGYTQHVV